MNPRNATAILKSQLASIPIGRPHNFHGLGITKLLNLYAIAGGSRLYTLDEVHEMILSKKIMSNTAPKIEIPSHPIFPETLRAMSCHFPWAWLISQGYKLEECRSRPTNFRGQILIQASGSTESDEIIRQYRIPEIAIARKAIIGAATIIDCQETGDGEYAYILEDAIALPQPIPCKGELRTFWKADTQERIHAFNRAWMMLNRKP